MFNDIQNDPAVKGNQKLQAASGALQKAMGIKPENLTAMADARKKKTEQAAADIRVDEAKQKNDATRATQMEDISKTAAYILANPQDTTALKNISSLRGDERMRLFNELNRQSGGRYDTGKIDSKIKVLNDFADGKAADNIMAFNTFMGHAADASSAVQAFRGNTNIAPYINKPMTWLDKNLTNDPTYTSLKTALVPVQKEFMNFLNNNRAEHEADIKTMDDIVNPTTTPARIQAALTQLAVSGDIRLRELGNKYKNTMGVPYEHLYSDEGSVGAARMLPLADGYTRVRTGDGKFYDLPKAQVAPAKAKHPDLVEFRQQ
jgi:hypothetical protein